MLRDGHPHDSGLGQSLTASAQDLLRPDELLPEPGKPLLSVPQEYYSQPDGGSIIGENSFPQIIPQVTSMAALIDMHVASKERDGHVLIHQTAMDAIEASAAWPNSHWEVASEIDGKIKHFDGTCFLVKRQIE